VQLTFPSRRVLGVLAAGTIGLSTALLGVTGVAQADTADAPVVAAANPQAAAAVTGPSAPTQIDVYGADGQLNVWFADDQTAVDSAWAASWEYQLTSTGGSGNTSGWTAFTPQNRSGLKYAEFTGLTNGTEYSVTLRGIGIDHNNGDAPVDGTASAQQTGTPYKPASAPGTPTVVVGPSSLKITWTGSTAGTYPIAQYDVLANLDLGPNAQSGGPTSICTVDAATRSCTAAVKAGRTYDVSVVASDTKQNPSDESTRITSAVVPNPAAPATVPTKNGDLSLPAGVTTTVAPGKTMTVSGSGYAPNSTITVAIYSTPQVLTTVVTDASGNFTATVTVPAGLEAGNHTLVASGVDSSGNVRYVNLPVTVSSSGTATITGKATLAYTGADVALPSIIGLVAVSLGAGLILVRRRARRSAA
jgi:LPXTG-motif cell wall-anchored protein